VSEIVRSLPRIKHHDSLEGRLDLIRQCLYDHSPLVRDASALALADLEDTNSIQLLEAACEREVIEELREDMQDIVLGLQSAQLCRL
jgi:hypothetical protein